VPDTTVMEPRAEPMDLEQALELAELHHRGQVDKAGQPYIGHIRRVVGAVDSRRRSSLLRSTISWRTRP